MVKQNSIEITARHRHAKLSAQKARLVADQIRNMDVEKALNVLLYHPKKAAGLVNKVLNSAVSNAEHNDGIDIDELKIKKIFVDEGPTLKRMRARAKGRGVRILKQSCHITIVLGLKNEKE